ncbi:uncharacterized protein LOC142977273 [Anticarsia gemmatalis]|uniref:uncharacterized protein LOC142977273 n=1 Tax=Anticarsia gemmatalis TaxID=129554 RepID=UPI003F771CD4
MFGVKFLCFAALMVCLGSSGVFAKISKEEKLAMKDAMKPFFMECVEEFSISKEDLAKMMAKKDKDDVDPCFIGCLFKKNGYITEQGTYDHEKAMEVTKPFIKSEDDVAIIEKIGQDCVKVNDEEVSDGEKGCERAKLLVTCFKEHKNEMDFEE